MVHNITISTLNIDELKEKMPFDIDHSSEDKIVRVIEFAIKNQKKIGAQYANKILLWRGSFPYMAIYIETPAKKMKHGIWELRYDLLA